MMQRLQESYPERRDEFGGNAWNRLALAHAPTKRWTKAACSAAAWLDSPLKILLLDEVTTSMDVCVRQDLLRWLVRESDVRGATILYATHIFDGLDDWATDLFFLTSEGRCGWNGKMKDLKLYQELVEKKHPAKMLAIAEAWLRKEMEANREKHRLEKAQGALAHELDPTDHHGGYGSGRNLPIEQPQEQRRGRLSDIMGNKGVLDKHR